MVGAPSANLIGILCHELAHWRRRDHWSADGKELFLTGHDAKMESTEYWTLENYLPDEKRAAR